jgi:hypothetical protein
LAGEDLQNIRALGNQSFAQKKTRGQFGIMTRGSHHHGDTRPADPNFQRFFTNDPVWRYDPGASLLTAPASDFRRRRRLRLQIIRWFQSAPIVWRLIEDTGSNSLPPQASKPGQEIFSIRTCAL